MTANSRPTGGETLASDVAVSLGNPENPMSWDDLRDKFTPLAESTLGEKTGEMFDSLCGFERPGSLGRIMSLAA